MLLLKRGREKTELQKSPGRKGQVTERAMGPA